MELKCKWNLTVELAGKFQLKDSPRWARQQYKHFINSVMKLGDMKFVDH